MKLFVNPTAMREIGNYYVLLNQLPILLIVKSYEQEDDGNFIGGEVRLASKAEADFHELTINEMVGKTDFDLFQEALAEEEREEDIVVMTSGKPITNINILCVDGVSQTVLSTKKPLLDGTGKVIGVMRVVMCYEP